MRVECFDILGSGKWAALLGSRMMQTQPRDRATDFDQRVWVGATGALPGWVGGLICPVRTISGQSEVKLSEQALGRCMDIKDIRVSSDAKG
jgi:hypothetical protein